MHKNLQHIFTFVVLVFFILLAFGSGDDKDKNEDTYEPLSHEHLGLKEYESTEQRDSLDSILTERKEKLLGDLSSSDKESTCPGARYMSEKEIERKLANPKTADFDLLGGSCDIENGLYVVLGKFNAENAFGVEKEFIYKVKLEYLGGHPMEDSSWKVINSRMEEYRP